MTVIADHARDHGPRPQTRAPRAPAHPRPDGQDSYTISEVVGLHRPDAPTLRWYERIGLMPHVDRSHTGQRRFSNRDLDWLDLVGKLRLTGMPVADMVRYAELVREGEDTFAERREILEKTRREVLARIAELQDTLAVLDRKIDFYADATPRPGNGRSAHDATRTDPKARLGDGGPEVGVQGLGCMGMSFAYGRRRRRRVPGHPGARPGTGRHALRHRRHVRRGREREVPRRRSSTRTATRS